MEEYLNVYLICCWHVLSMIILVSSLLSLCWHIGLFVSFWFKFTVSLVDIWFVGFILSCCLFESSCSGEISGGKNYVLAGGRTKCIGEITTTFFNVWGFLIHVTNYSHKYYLSQHIYILNKFFIQNLVF